MAITTYSELQTSVANWTHRADLSNRIPEFISLAEAKFNRELRVSGMEKRATTVVGITTEYVALPTDFLEARNFQLATTPVTLLRQMSPEEIDARYQGNSGKPRFYAIVGDEFQLAPSPDGEYFLELDYWSRITPLSDVDTSNWLLEDHPDLYLCGALCQAIPYLNITDARVPALRAEYASLMGSLQASSDRRRWTSSSMQMRASVQGL